MTQILKLSVVPSDEVVPEIQAVGSNGRFQCSGWDDTVSEKVDIKPESRIVFHTEPGTPGADRIRYLRMHLRKLREARSVKTVLITSPVARDGKSTLALNLATAMAEEGKNRVLLLEADLHHAPLARDLGVSKLSGGLTDCLDTGVDPWAVMRRIDPLNWYFLPAGSVRKNVADLLQTSAYGGLVKGLSERFDWIFVDSPPVVPVTDALFLRQHSDATLLVVRAGRTPQDAIEEALRQLGRQHVAAVILNGVEGLHGMYYKYGGSYYENGKSAKSGPE